MSTDTEKELRADQSLQNAASPSLYPADLELTHKMYVRA